MHFPELSYASGQNARRRQTYPRAEKLNRSNQRKGCAAIRDIIMSYVAETTILCKGAHSEGARKSLEGAKNGLEGAQKVLEVQNRISYVFLRFPTFSYDSLPFVHFPELSYASGQNARRCQTNPRDEKLNRSYQSKVCAAIRDIIMSYIAETTILRKGVHSDGARISLEGAKKRPDK